MAMLPESTGKPALKKRIAETWMDVIKNKERYLLVLPGLIWYAIFAYIPIYGLTLAFKKFIAKDGIFGSPWDWPGELRKRVS